MTTKDDYATKEDIARLEAKSATKDDIAKLEAKLDGKIDSSTKRLALEIVKTSGRIDEVETRLTKTITENTDRILTSLDRYSRIVEADNRAVTIHGSILTEVQLKLQGHDLRIAALESARARPEAQ
jgi:hypothetical protein